MTSYDDIIQFIRVRDYRLVRELGQGACGKTVLLHDDLIDEDLVCKKYQPYSEEHRQTLFNNFKREIKLLYQIHHHNVVRVFNYYLYPDHFTGYILMEFVEGKDVGSYVAGAPETLDELFVQAVDGFRHLETLKILHRDVRVQNLMVTDSGILKIIDLGFGKQIETSDDFDKSISLNLWCEPPHEFADHVYNFGTEIYFVGKLFERLIHDNNVQSFKYSELLGKMCQNDPDKRISSFVEVNQAIQSDRFPEIDFLQDELESYRDFSDELFKHITKIQHGAKYIDDVDHIQSKLTDMYRSVMLEEYVPDLALITRCFIDGPYYYKKSGFSVGVIRDFLRIFTAAPLARKRIILANLHTRLDAVERYPKPVEDDDIPF